MSCLDGERRYGLRPGQQQIGRVARIPQQPASEERLLHRHVASGGPEVLIKITAWRSRCGDPLVCLSLFLSLPFDSFYCATRSGRSAPRNTAFEQNTTSFFGRLRLDGPPLFCWRSLLLKHGLLDLPYFFWHDKNRTVQKHSAVYLVTSSGSTNTDTTVD